MGRVSFMLKDCRFYINNELVEKDDALIAMTSELALGEIPQKLLKFKLTEDELSDLDLFLSNEIFINGKCLTPDVDFLLENQDYGEDDEVY